MKQVVVAGGGIDIVDVPAPTIEPGYVLVRTRASAISPGTETSSGAGSEGNLVMRAARNPDLVKKVLSRAQQTGWRETAELVRGRLKATRPTGYSAMGVVESLGEGVDHVRPGDRVACAGAGFANHAEWLLVPRLLCVPVPDSVSDASAAFTTIGAIALQGVRQLQPSIGETVVVVGLGIVGQLTVQIAASHGCRVIAADTDSARVQRAVELSGCEGVDLSTSALGAAVIGLTSGRGADGVLITAATRSDAPLNEAMDYCRERARVVVVGDVGLGLRRQSFYLKEIEVRISRSYGPGRYDREYEEGGTDYPIGYVRWTEQRNMECVLDLVAGGRLSVEPLIDLRVPVEDAAGAYRRIGEDHQVLGVLIEYPAVAVAGPQNRAVLTRHTQPRSHIRLGLIGAGAFARATHIPNLRGDARVSVIGVAARTGVTASSVARTCGAELATTDWRALISELDLDAVLITTQHDLHADQVLEALERGLHVFVEKPMALHRRQCEAIVAKQSERGRLVVTGFNRRFAPAVMHAATALRSVRGPRNALIRVNAGRLPASHWTYGPHGGGRVLGEGCHFFDLARFLVGSEPVALTAAATSGGAHAVEDTDNLSAVVEFGDGSVATVIYATTGSSDTPKERFEIYADGASVVVDDFRRCTVAGVHGVGSKTYRSLDKGHRALLEHAMSAFSGAEPAPLDAYDGLIAQACAEAALASSATHERVVLGV